MIGSDAPGSRGGWLWLAALALGAASGCADDTPPSSAPALPPCSRGLPSLGAAGVTLSDSCGNHAALRPAVLVGGAWRGAGADGACSLEAERVRCPAGAAGFVTASLTLGQATVRFDAAEDSVAGGLSLEGDAAIDGATGFLSNGFQSWSQSGVVALGPAPSLADLASALAARGDEEVLRDGKAMSFTMSYVGGGRGALLAGALSATTWVPWVQASREAAGAPVRVRLVSGGTGEQVSVAKGTSVDGEAFRLELGGNLVQALSDYGAAIPSRRSSKRASASMGWNSWYQLWDGVDDAAVRANDALAAGVLAPYLGTGAMRVVVDDGWEKAWGDWVPNAKFPQGLDGLAKDLKAKGRTMGVWLAPLLAEPTSEVATAHPGWFVGGASYHHALHGDMRVLDVTNPDAAAHLASVVQTIVSWGYSLLKIDFLFAGTLEGARMQPTTRMKAYARALEIIRGAVGEDVELVAVGAPDVATFPYVDGWRVGADIALEPSDVTWFNVANEARSIAARAPFCLATLCDGDPILLRKLTRDEVDAGGWVAAFAGGALFLSDDLRALPPDRRTWGLDATRAAQAIAGAPAVPEDLFPDAPPTNLTNVVVDLVKRRTTHVVPRIWATPSGRVGLNVSDDAATIEGVSVPPHAARPLPPAPP